jgi:hypothetical protein
MQSHILKPMKVINLIGSAVLVALPASDVAAGGLMPKRYPSLQNPWPECRALSSGRCQRDNLSMPMAS